MNTIYVYDQRMYFIPFLRKKYAKQHHFIRLNDVKLMKADNYTSNDVGIFIANNVNDVLAFFKFKECFKDRIILCTEKSIIYEKYKKTFPISFIDISKPKNQFYQELSERFEILFPNSQL